MNINKYSIAIIPDKTVINTVKDLKIELAETIGWYKSKNSVAHFTIGEFEASEHALRHIHEQINRICEELQPFGVRLSEIRTFEKTGTLYIAPDEASSLAISNLSSQFHKKFNLSGTIVNPHMTIGRGLSPVHLKTGQHLLLFKPTEFNCNAISLRRFNPHSRQYEVINTYPL